MIIDCISDLHGHYPELEGGDLLIVAGDLTARDTEEEYFNFIKWLNKQQYHKTIIIAGNHDNLLMSPDFTKNIYSLSAIDKDNEYLCDSGTEFEGLKIWGSPWTKFFPGMNPDCKAFTVETEEQLSKKWDLIPDDTDILITHMPPNGIFDGVLNYHIGNAEDVGSQSLRHQVIQRIKPKLHVFGHIHEHGGKMLDAVTTKFVNASHVNVYYAPVNKPVRIEL